MKSLIWRLFQEVRIEGSVIRNPRIYFPEIIKERGEEALINQCIPVDPELHKIENYPKFLAARRAALATQINAHLTFTG